MEDRNIESGSVPFEAEGRLLQELGERLVGDPDIALVELIKNAYDADAVTCSVKVLDEGQALTISDDGIGMTKDQFLKRWMKIATAHKVEEPLSTRFGRKRTGQKGIGRFAVRFLGSILELVTVSHDSTLKRRTRLRATFDWKKLDASSNLRDFRISYTLMGVDESTPTGTTLRVESLRHDLGFLESKEFRTGVLRIVSPFESLHRGRFRRRPSGTYENDPGFQVLLPGAEEEENLNIAKEVLDRAWGRLQINLQKDKVEYIVTLAAAKKPKTLVAPFKASISAGLVADIRYFPRRQGIFRGGSVDGRAAWTWVRDNCGVAVVDHGFRIRPFGFTNDDWLHLDIDAAHNVRDWRSSIANEHFAIPQELKPRPGDNPALNLPTNYQLVGAVFVESRATGAGDDLTTSMDREGFLNNGAFEQLRDVIRGGIEFLALVDKKHLLTLAEVRAEEASQRVREDFKTAIDSIRESDTLSAGDKSRLVEHYSSLAKKVEEVEEYSREARRKLETMGLLGVVAGFMTHEASRILDGLEKALERLRGLSDKDARLREAIKLVEEGYTSFKGHVDYTTLFIESLHTTKKAEFKAAPQITRILDRFGAFGRDRNIDSQNSVSKDLYVRGIPIAAYSGILLNLYTNALKAVVARQGKVDGPHIVFRASEGAGLHVVEVLDKGVGIPTEIKSRIFDPLFTTTSNTGNPLGSGMGLGLSLVKDVVTQLGGTITLGEPPVGFATCFRVELPNDEG